MDEPVRLVSPCGHCSRTAVVAVEAPAVETLVAFAADRGALLRAQDNASTSHPVYVVESRDRIYGVDPDYGCDTIWCEEHGDYDEVPADLAAHLEAGHEKGLDPPEGYVRFGYLDRWTFVTACLTRVAAEAFCKRQAHNYRKRPLRVFVYSGNENHEWIQLRLALAGIAKAMNLPPAEEGTP